MIVAVVLAAGRSERMGRPKPFLPYDLSGNTFLRQLVGNLTAAGIVKVYIVGRLDDGELASEARSLGAVYVPNAAAHEGQISSVRAGLTAAIATGAELSGILVAPVDVPCVSAAVVRALVDAAQRSDAAIIRPVCRGRHGHPVVFKSSVFEELRRADSSTGAKAVVHANPARVLDLEVSEEGVTIDIDTPADYERVFGRKL